MVVMGMGITRLGEGCSAAGRYVTFVAVGMDPRVEPEDDARGEVGV